MEEDSSLAPSKCQVSKVSSKSLDLKNVMFVKMKALEKRWIFIFYPSLRKQGKNY